MEILITTLTGILASVLSGGITYLYTRKKYNSEVDNTLITNMQESLVFYTKLSDDNSARLQDLLTDYSKLREQFEDVLNENNQLKIEVIKLRSQIASLTKELKKFNKVI